MQAAGLNLQLSRYEWSFSYQLNYKHTQLGTLEDHADITMTWTNEVYRPARLIVCPCC